MTERNTHAVAVHWLHGRFDSWWRFSRSVNDLLRPHVLPEAHALE